MKKWPVQGTLVSRVIRNGAIDARPSRPLKTKAISCALPLPIPLPPTLKKNGCNYSAAARYLQAALLFLPITASCWRTTPPFCCKLGQPAEALLRAQQAARVSPQSADAFLLLGYAYYKNDHDREAIAALKKSLQLRPDDKTRDLLERVERESRTEADFRQQESSHFTLRYEGSQAPTRYDQMLDALEADYRDQATIWVVAQKYLCFALYRSGFF